MKAVLFLVTGSKIDMRGPPTRRTSRSDGFSGRGEIGLELRRDSNFDKRVVYLKEEEAS